jgi:hypothetical protein
MILSSYKRIEINIPKEWIIEIDRVWQSRDYPDPKNPKKTLSFTSRTEYILFVLRCSTMMNKTGWYFYKYMFNPDLEEK